MTQLQQVLADLAEEGEQVHRMLAGLDDRQWQLDTPAPGWTVHHQVAHMTATFRLAALAAAKPEAFTALLASLGTDFDANVHGALQPYLAESPAELLPHWREQLAASGAALAQVPEDSTVPWLARPLPPAILGSAGLMELFAHGQDIADAVGVTPERTDRIIHLTSFAVRVWDFAYLVRDLPVPEREFRFELTAPSGALWTFGPQDAEQRITGSAVGFCLLATRRRHRDDVDVRATGEIADGWLSIAQAYRGTPGSGRVAGQFAPSLA